MNARAPGSARSLTGAQDAVTLRAMAHSARPRRQRRTRPTMVVSVAADVRAAVLAHASAEHLPVSRVVERLLRRALEVTRAA